MRIVIDTNIALDLLVFDDPQGPADTMLADVRRVPPAHVLTWTLQSGVSLRAYWRLVLYVLGAGCSSAR